MLDINVRFSEFHSAFHSESLEIKNVFVMIVIFGCHDMPRHVAAVSTTVVLTGMVTNEWPTS